jgi:hypothetical protein
MHYLILIYGDEKKWASLSPEAAQQEMAAYGQYTHDLVAAGVSRAGAALAPVATATSIRMQKGKPTVTDGPFAETKEQLGGFYHIEVANLDEALHWAGRCPGAASGCIEVRPVTILTKPDGTVEMMQP